MNDRAISLLEQYDIEVLRTRKGRGTFIFDTKQGMLQMKEYYGRPEKLELQRQILDRIKAAGIVGTEDILPCKDGQLSVKDSDGVSYIVKTYCEGEECDIYDRKQCLEVMQILAKLHNCMNPPGRSAEMRAGYAEFSENHPPRFSPLQEYEKHNRELTRIRSYLKKKSPKQAFEKKLLASMPYFIQKGTQVRESWIKWEQEREDTYCHGDYQYHNVLRTQEGWRVINFEKVTGDSPVRDIALLMRKVMEKNNWQISLGREMLEAYESVRRLDEYDRQDLYHRFAYPEKFWKIANFYFNSAKAWIPEKSQEKLEKVLVQEREKQGFLEAVFGAEMSDKEI